MMDHEYALNHLLANACPTWVSDDGDIRQFTFDIHCVEAVITAKLVSTVDSIQYEIISIDMEDN